MVAWGLPAIGRGGGMVMDAFEIGLKLAAPDALKGGLAAVFRTLNLLDAGTRAAWAGALERRRREHGFGTSAPSSGATRKAGGVGDESGPGEQVVEVSGEGAARSAGDVGGGGRPVERGEGSGRADTQSEAIGLVYSGEEQGLGSAGSGAVVDGLRGRRAAGYAAPIASQDAVIKPALRFSDQSDGSGLALAMGPAVLQPVPMVGVRMASSNGLEGASSDVDTADDGWDVSEAGGDDALALAGPGEAKVVSDVATVIDAGLKGRASNYQVDPGQARRSSAPSQGGGRGSRRLRMGGDATMDAGFDGGGQFSTETEAMGGDEGGADGGGTTIIELDGRIIGQLLSERLGREASRPGAGTTFFDPRQSPAWTPAGSL